MTYDNYNEIIGKLLEKVHQVLKTGEENFYLISASNDKAKNKQMGLEEAPKI